MHFSRWFVVLLAVALLGACGNGSEPATGSAGGEESEADPEAIGAEIERLLDEIVQTYEAGDADVAAELAAEAYLENYEEIEHEVDEAAHEVNEELETLLGAELRKQINAGVPLDEIEEMVSEAKQLLADVLEAIEG